MFSTTLFRAGVPLLIIIRGVVNAFRRRLRSLKPGYDNKIMHGDRRVTVWGRRRRRRYRYYCRSRCYKYIYYYNGGWRRPVEKCSPTRGFGIRRFSADQLF